MGKKLRCLLLDDELPGLTYLKMLCDQLPNLEVVKAYNNASLFLSEIGNIEFDLCLMDIEMPDLNGLQLAALLKNKKVIFITAYKDYAAEAFDLNAIDYIRKPYTRQRLEQAINKIQKIEIESRPVKRHLQLNTDQGKTNLFFDQIVYVKTAEMDSRDKKIFLTENRVINAKNISFDKLMEALPKTDFCRINKKELVALSSVAYFSFDTITLLLNSEEEQKVKLQLSETYRKEFLTRYSN